jgi:periplasmic protein CpxP/Spy
MRYQIARLACAVAAAGILTAAGLGWAAGQGLSPSPTPVPPAPASTSTASPAVSPPTITTAAPHGPVLSVEGRIADLDKRLGITSSERSQFAAMAEIMRANAKMMDALLVERQHDTNRSAVDSLHWYQRLTEAHAAALKKFVPAFDALYAVLSARQRETADTVFQQLGQQPPPLRSR